ncbi:MAG: LTA synthase family protein, partial [Bacteroidales bacterium]|nr:LTA synthase family protein [Bacteroidales bacterium]
GKKSIEGIPAILASVPTMVEKPFIMTELCSDSLFSIARLLSAHGYGTSFFHNGYNGVLGFDRMARQMGFSNYYGMNEYNATPYAKPEDYDGMWGIFDEPFLQYFGRELSHQPQPFLAVEFTASSHHPYTMPDSHKGEFPDGLHPLLPVVSYTDYALRRFFDSVAQQPWFYNTIFVITADHPGQGLHRQYNDYDGWYDIPMMFFAPGDSLAGVSHRLMQQLDVLPTLADMLHLPDTFACLGVSAVASPRIGSQVLYGNGYYMMLRNDLLRPHNHSYVAIEGRYIDGDRTMRQDLIDFIGAYNHYLEQQQTANGSSSSTN